MRHWSKALGFAVGAVVRPFVFESRARVALGICRTMNGSMTILALVILLQAGWAGVARADLYTGPIVVTDSSNAANDGYFSNTFNIFGEYTITSNLANALIVTFNTGAGSPFAITETNNSASSAHPFVGGVQGFSATSPNLGSGSFNYAYFAGTDLTAANATPASGGNTFTDVNGISEDIESTIWSLSGDNLLAQWINTNSSAPSTFDVFTLNTLVMTGDVTTFEGTFGGDQVLFSIVPGDLSSVPEPASLALFAPALLGLGFLIRRKHGAS